MSNFTEKGYYFTSLKSELENAQEEFRDYWNNLPTDNYIEGKNKFRQRRYSRLRYNPIHNSIENIGSTYFQEEEYNNLFGGQHRVFDPAETGFLNNLHFLHLLEFDFRFFHEQGLLENKPYEIGIHQIRTMTKSHEPGKVTPEGIHKDGHPVFAIHLVDRQNIKGGTTNLYANNLEKIEVLVLENFGDTLLIQDDYLYHEVTPITRETEEGIGFRDVLITEFY